MQEPKTTVSHETKDPSEDARQREIAKQAAFNRQDKLAIKLEDELKRQRSLGTPVIPEIVVPEPSRPRPAIARTADLHPEQTAAQPQFAGYYSQQSQFQRYYQVPYQEPIPGWHHQRTPVPYYPPNPPQRPVLNDPHPRLTSRLPCWVASKGQPLKERIQLLICKAQNAGEAQDILWDILSVSPGLASARDDDGQTLLHLTVRYDKEGMTWVILGLSNKEALLAEKNYQGQTPSDYARQFPISETHKALLTTHRKPEN